MQKLLVLIHNNQDLQHVLTEGFDVHCRLLQINMEVSAALEILVLQFYWTVLFFFPFLEKYSNRLYPTPNF